MKLSLERGRLFSEITLLLGLLAYVVVYHGLVMNYMQMRALEKFKAVTDTNGDHVLSTEELVTSLGNMMGASAYKDGEFLYVGLVFIFDMNKDNAYDEVELSALLDALDSFNEATDLMRSIGGDHLWKPSFTLLAFATVALLALFVDLAMSALRYEKSVETLECELAETRVHHDELHDAFEEYEVSKKREASSKESRKTALKKLHSARASVSLLNVGKQGSREVVVDPQPGDLLRTSLVKSTAASASASDGNVTAAWRAKLHQAAGRMREPSYDLKSFHLDMVECFPELLLYLADSADASSALGALEKEELVGLSRHLVQHGTPPHGMALGTSLVGGARTGLEEYNRTIGALFAVYWLSRLELPAVKGSAGLDGQRGFCFGVDAASWRPLEPEKAEEAEKRRKFLDTQDWAKLHQLMLDAGVLQQEGADAAVDVPRMAAMLTLTAIHDIMKNTALLPTVAAKHAPYMGHEAGVVIADHDEALGYVLTHDADSLPCYAALPESQRAPIRFTQADMGFNNGHLAEAPPGALFSKFKAVLEAGHASAADVAFYFVHWVTDLAGAEPTPLEGSKKFALKFPAPVLKQFVNSFPIIQGLAHSTPTALNERFLLEFCPWQSTEMGALPTGPHAICLLRLVTQAASGLAASNVACAFPSLPLEQKSTLGREMAYTGRAGEQYELGTERSSAASSCGPAFLVYYSPAFVRQSAAKSESAARLALCQLADTYRAARLLFPLGTSDEDASRNVTVNIDALKGMADAKAISDSYTEGAVWALVKTQPLEAKVERFSQLGQMPDFPSEKHEVLHLWQANFEATA